MPASKTQKLFFKLFGLLPKRRAKAFFFLIPLAILSAFLDIGIVIAASRLFSIFVNVPSTPSIPLDQLKNIDPIWKLVALLISYISLNWIASFVKISLKAFQSRLKACVWRDLAELVQKKVLMQPYEYFLQSRKQDISTTILVITSRVADIVFLPFLRLITGGLSVILISFSLLKIASIKASIILFSILIFYFSFSSLITPFIKIASKKKILLERKTNSILNEALSTIVDLKLSHSEVYFNKKYSAVGRQSISSIWKADTWPEVPRALIEPLGITIIFTTGLAPYLFNFEFDQFYKAIPFLVTIAIAALKITPPLQESFRSLVSIRGSLPDLIELLKFLDLPEPEFISLSTEITSPQSIQPRLNIKLKDLSYKYPLTDKFVLKNLNITIPVGSRVAFVGKTGSGKTTTANQLLCLLRPTTGSLQIDGIKVTESEVLSWQECCSYVPQSINLLNESVLDNVAYGLFSQEIDLDRAWEAIEAAQLAEFIADLPQGIHTNVGENGIRFSGGQRQRLALARAFYKKSRFIVLDEATSALDNQTESDVMEAIELVGRRSTILLIAHRLSTVTRADYIYEFENGSIKASGNFKTLRDESDSFYEMTSFGDKNLIFNDEK
tara:strand:- start:282 stop:2120 length:1839 start_codon:yes stop_codon:yes gene_type:complete